MSFFLGTVLFKNVELEKVVSKVLISVRSGLDLLLDIGTEELMINGVVSC